MRPAVFLAAALMAAPALADGPVVVELYTSQGCSACPPADALLHDLAGRDDVIALGLHVDYWDYIGWADPFALPGNAQRQKRYAHRAGDRMVYTPQIVIDGAVAMPGNRVRAVEAAIEQRLEKPGDGPDVTLSRDGDRLTIRAGTVRLPGRAVDVTLATYEIGHSTHITAGENAGHELSYANVVTAMQPLRRWDGAAPIEITVMASGPVAVLLQAAEQGEILGAAKLD